MRLSQLWHNLLTQSQHHALKLKAETRYQISPLLFNIVVEVAANAIRQEIKVGGIKVDCKRIIAIRQSESLPRKPKRINAKTMTKKNLVDGYVYISYTEIKKINYRTKTSQNQLETSQEI